MTNRARVRGLSRNPALPDAADRRLSQERLLELFAEPETAEAAAANPSLPPDLMVAILDASDS